MPIEALIPTAPDFDVRGFPIGLRSDSLAGSRYGRVHGMGESMQNYGVHYAAKAVTV